MILQELRIAMGSHLVEDDDVDASEEEMGQSEESAATGGDNQIGTEEGDPELDDATMGEISEDDEDIDPYDAPEYDITRRQSIKAPSQEMEGFLMDAIDALEDEDRIELIDAIKSLRTINYSSDDILELLDELLPPEDERDYENLYRG